MIEHFVIPVFSTLWWQGLTFSALMIATPVVLGKRLNDVHKYQLGFILGLFLLFLTVSLHPYMIHAGVWTMRSSLPLQLCSLSALLSGLIFFYRTQLLYEILVYWGLAGAIHSILTPEISLGGEGYIIFEYYAAHAGIIMAAIFMTRVYGFKPREGSWLKVFLITQIVMLSVGLINYLVDANYMYLCKKPMANNPFIIGEWPWYVLGLEVAGLLHFLAVYLIFKVTGQIQKSEISASSNIDG